jgi:hypothetical protein
MGRGGTRPSHMNDEFYIGWEAKAAPGLAKTLRKIAASLLCIAILTSVGLAVSQRMIGTSVFEWGDLKTFSGILRVAPYPHLLVKRPGSEGTQPAFSTYHLVAPWKFGLDPKTIAPLDGQLVSLKGTLIYRGDQTMVEVAPGSIAATNTLVAPPLPQPRLLGRQTLVGEIVDSKCFLGVMNPGQLTPHRACAIRCISGGVPPVLLVRPKDGPAVYFLLVSADGRAVNKQVLDLVAEPIEITGNVERQGELLILRADPETYRRIR